MSFLTIINTDIFNTDNFKKVKSNFNQQTLTTTIKTISEQKLWKVSDFKFEFINWLFS